MPNPAVDHQVRIALRDDQKAEKFAERIAELAAHMVNTTFEFAEDVKRTYESEAFPKRRRGDRSFDQTDHAKLALGAFSFLCMLSTKFCVVWISTSYERLTSILYWECS